MFERYTEKARRVIFFARYEASQYGSLYIETEHMLLGLLREDPNLTRLLPNMKSVDEIRREAELHIEARERISTSVEIPLSAQCKRALNLAAEEADRLASHSICTEHLLLGLLRIKDGLAVKIVNADELYLGRMREKLQISRPKQYEDTISVARTASQLFPQAVEGFLAALRDGSLNELEYYFGSESCFVDASGKLWQGQKEIAANFDLLLAPFAKRSAKPVSAAYTAGNEALWLTTLIWEDVHLPGYSPPDLFRMSIVFGTFHDLLIIYLIQITPIGRGVLGKTAAS